MAKHVIGAAIGYDELRAWRATTGLDTPGEVPLGATLQVGRCTIRLEVGPGRDLPKIKLAELTRKKYKPRNHWHHKPVKGAAASNRPWVEASLRAIPDEAEWERVA